MREARPPKRSGLLTLLGTVFLLGGLGAIAGAVVSGLVAGGSISLDDVVSVANDDPAAWRRVAIVFGVSAVGLLIAAGFCLSAAGRRRRARKNRPRSGHRMTTQRHWQGQIRAGTILTLFVGAGAVSVALVLVAKQQGRSSEDSSLLIPAGIVGGVGLLFVAIGLWWRRQLRARQRALAIQSAPLGRAGSPPAPPAADPLASLPAASPPAAFEAQLVRPRDLPKGKIKGRPVTTDSNVVGAPPFDILYLRVFDNHERARTYVESAWREFGYVNLIRNAASISPKELRDGTIEASMVLSIDDARRAWAARPRGVDGEKHKKIEGVAFAPVRVRDPVGSYPVFSMFCHDTAWQAAVELLLDHAGLVTMDLAGVDTDNPGSLYEIGRLFDRYPVDQVLFLVDQRSDVEFIVRNLRPQWDRMHADSPNRHGTRTVRFVQTDHYAQRRDQNGNSTIALVSDRGDSRRVLAAWASGRLQGRPVG